MARATTARVGYSTHIEVIAMPLIGIHWHDRYIPPTHVGEGRHDPSTKAEQLDAASIRRAGAYLGTTSGSR